MKDIFKFLQSNPEFRFLKDQRWRLSNLYFIKDKEGNKIKFKPNWAQLQLLHCDHPCHIVLKARQLGITTFYSLYLLDSVLWYENQSAGIIAQTLDDASSIFRDRLKFAFDHLHPSIRALFKVLGDSAKELRFAHGSYIRVGTSLRGSTLNLLHISEFGKICAKYAERALEIMTGSLQTVHAGQKIFIESTAEGKEGYFYEMTQKAFAQEKENKPFNLLDFKPFFFPWHKHNEYYLQDSSTSYSRDLEDYFNKLSVDGIHLSEGQKQWYAKKKELLHEEVLREYPSTPSEAFASSHEGNWYAKQIKELYDLEHIINISYDKSIPVHTSWDLGQNDAMAIWFFQINRVGEIMLIDYFEMKDFSIDHIAQMLKEKRYTYGTHLWPHDARSRDRAGITFEMQAMNFNIYGTILDIHSVLDGINLVRTTLSKCWFDKKKCQQGLNRLTNYKKKWNSQIGGFTSQPLHDENSHGADAFRYLCAGLNKIDDKSTYEDNIKVINHYFRA